MASAAGIQGADKLADNLAIMPTLSDMFNTPSSAVSSSGLSAGNWGAHTVSINTGTDWKSLLLWGGVGLFAYWLIKRIRQGG